MNSILRRRRAMMAQKTNSDFVQLEYIQSPSSSAKDAMIILPQVFNDFESVILDATIVSTSYNIVFTSWDGSKAGTPYCGKNNRDMTMSPAVQTNRTVYTATKTSTTNGTYRARIGGWGDNVFSKSNKYYRVSLINSNNVMIADYIFGYLKSTNETGAYDLLTNTFYPEASGLVGFTRGPEV